MTDYNLTAAHRRLLELRILHGDEMERHRKAIHEIDRERLLMLRNIEECSAGLDPKKIAIAEAVLQIRGQFGNGAGDTQSVIDAAISDLATTGGTAMQETQFAVKNYDRWERQRSDHSYGCGPRHGSIVFAVGLHPHYRTVAPSAGAIEAAIYYLGCLPRIEQARKEAQAKVDAAFGLATEAVAAGSGS